MFALLIARRARMSWTTRAIAFLWGAAVASTFAGLGNDALARVVDASLLPAVVGPFVEEVMKASGVLVLAAVARDALAGVRRGVAAGAVVGLGFAATENIGYYTLAAVQGGPAGLVRAIYLRGLIQGLNHAAFTAATGAGVGWGWTRGGAAAVAGAVGGLAVAVVAHGVWNGLTSGMLTGVLCNAPTPDGACAPAPDAVDLFVTAPLLVAASIGPLAVGIGLLMRRERAAA